MGVAHISLLWIPPINFTTLISSERQKLSVLWRIYILPRPSRSVGEVSDNGPKLVQRWSDKKGRSWSDCPGGGIRTYISF